MQPSSLTRRQTGKTIRAVTSFSVNRRAGGAGRGGGGGGGRGGLVVGAGGGGWWWGRAGGQGQARKAHLCLLKAFLYFF